MNIADPITVIIQNIISGKYREIVLNDAECEDMLAFIDNEMELLEKRKASAAKRAEKKKQESDALTDRIYALLDEDLITVDEILEELDDEEVTRNKVTARLGKLVKAGKVEKETVKVDGNRRMAYCLADKVDETEE